MKAIWGACKWAGRVSLWFLFLPLGLWRSYRHGANKRSRKLAEQVGYGQSGDWRKAYTRITGEPPPPWPTSIPPPPPPPPAV